MRKWLLLILVLTSAISVAISGRLTLTGVLAQAIMFGGIFGPMHLFPGRHGDWTARCRLPSFSRRG